MIRLLVQFFPITDMSDMLMLSGLRSESRNGLAAPIYGRFRIMAEVGRAFSCSCSIVDLQSFGNLGYLIP